VSLALTWPCRHCLLRVFLWASATSFPLSKHWERWHCTRIVRPVCLFTVHVGGGSSPLSCGVFLPPPLSQAFLLLVAGHTPPLPPEPLWPALLVYLQSREGFPSPNLRRSVRPTLFLVCLICSYCLLLSFSFFPRWRSGCPGVMLLWPRLVCGSNVVPWSSPDPHLPKLPGRGRLVAWGPSWFLCLMWSGDSLHRLEVWRGQSYASSQWLCLQSVSPASLQDFTIGGSLSASSL
jgi:hypothetical protein